MSYMGRRSLPGVVHQGGRRIIPVDTKCLSPSKDLEPSRRIETLVVGFQVYLAGELAACTHYMGGSPNSKGGLEHV